MKKVENYKLEKLWKNLKLYVTIDKEIVKFVGTEIEKYKFHQHKSPILIDDIDISEIWSNWYR